MESIWVLAVSPIQTALKIFVGIRALIKSVFFLHVGYVFSDDVFKAVWTESYWPGTCAMMDPKDSTKHTRTMPG